MSHPAMLHDPVLGRTRRVSVRWNPAFHGSLAVEDDSGTIQEVALRDLSLSQGGWRGDALTFSWQHEGKAWAVTVDDPNSVAQLARVLPPHFVDQIVMWQRRNRRSTYWSSTALAIAGLITLLPLLLLLALFIFRDRVVDIIISRMPLTVDAQIGELTHRQLAGSGDLIKEGPAVDAVREASRRLVSTLPSQDFTFRFEVLNEKSVNAFAVPGGLVVVHAGLLAKATSADQLAGVLGHEISHVTHRHSLRQLIRDVGVTTTLRWLIGLPDGVAGTIAGLAVNLDGLKFSRDQEADADRGGVELLQKARLPATGLRSFMDILAKESGSPGGGIPSFLSTHPADEERSAALQKVIEELGQWEVEPLTLDWEAVRRDAEARIKK